MLLLSLYYYCHYFFNSWIENLKSENKALNQELDHLSNQLAQRTVLFAAQKRQFHDNDRYNQSKNQEYYVENLGLYDFLCDR